MKSGRYVSLSLAGAAGAALLLTYCRKEEAPPPPLPSAEPVATAAPPLELTVEDAGVDAADAGKKKVGTGGPAKSMAACCNALAQNAKSAPPPTSLYMAQAAALCSGAVASGKDAGSVLAIVSGALKGAGMPASCR